MYARIASGGHHRRRGHCGAMDEGGTGCVANENTHELPVLLFIPAP